MTLPEVLVSVVILGISSHASLQCWSATTSNTVRSEQRQQQLQQLDQQVLAVGRLLVRLPADPEVCRFTDEGLDQLAAALPVHAPLQQRLERAPAQQGVWLELTLPDQPLSLQRRVLFTPAGLGLCVETDA